MKYRKKYKQPLPFEPKHAWEIAAYEGPDGEKIGKEFMLGTEWDGIKEMDPKNEGWKVGQKYYESKGL